MLSGIPVSSLTASTLLGIVVLLILTGMLVPRKTMMDRINELKIIIDDKTKEAERWHKASEKDREARVKSDEQTTELLEVTKTSNAILVAMFGREGALRKLSGVPNVVAKKE